MRLQILALLSSLAFAASASAAPLVSPWDVHPVKPIAGEYLCKVPPATPKDIVSYDYYSDAQHSKIDPVRHDAYLASVEPFHVLTTAAIKAADDYGKTARAEAASCVLQVLLAQAKAGAMTGSMASNQSYYVQGWTIGSLAVTWLKVRAAEPGTAADRKVVTDWLATVAKSTEAYFQARHAKGTSDGRNNHLYWAGFAVMSAGIAANDKAMFDWGVMTYNDGMSRIAADGTLPLEMERGQKALHYHLFAISPLVTMAEFGAVNGVDLYGANGKALTRLIDRSVSGLQDNSYFAEKAKAAQDTPEDGHIKSADVLALTPYARRFHDEKLGKIIAEIPPKPDAYLGGLPPA